MASSMRLEDNRLYTRQELLGLSYSSTQFQRWGEAGLLTPVKPGGSPSSRVHYWGWNVNDFLSARIQAA